MEALAAALIIIFCTPFGWIGIIATGFAVSMVVESIHDKKKEKENK